jgi:hypothetical protein
MELSHISLMFIPANGNQSFSLVFLITFLSWQVLHFYFLFFFSLSFLSFVSLITGNILHTVTDGLIALPQLAIASAINPATNNANVTSTPASPDDEVKTLFPDEIIKIFFDYLLFVPKIDNIRIQSVLFSPYFASNMVVDDFLDPDITSTQTPEREISSPSGSLQALSQNKCSLARSVVYLVEDPNTPNNGGETPKGNKDASQLTNPRSSLSLETSPMLTNQVGSQVYSFFIIIFLFFISDNIPSTPYMSWC